MINLRYKRLKSGKYSVHLDCDSKALKKRQWIATKEYVSKEYTEGERIKTEDKEAMLRVQKKRKAKQLEISALYNNVSLKQKATNESLTQYLDKKKSISRTKTLITSLNKFTGSKELLFREITLEWLERYKSFLMSEVAHNTARDYLKCLQARMNDAVVDGLIQENIFNNFDIPVEQKVEQIKLGLEEVEKLVNEELPKYPQFRLAYLFSCASGLRGSEIKGLKWKDIVTRSGRLHIKIIPPKLEKEYNRTFYMPLTASALKILEELKRGKQGGTDSEREIFDKLPSEGYSRDLIKIWAANAGVRTDIHFHSGRHTFATIALTHDISIYSVNKLLGQSSIRTTERYAVVTENKKKKEIKKLPKI